MGGHIVHMTTLVHQPVQGVPSKLASLTKFGLDAVTVGVLSGRGVG